ncbi:Uroporphyrinogen decarboxylase (URO-D) [Neomoorella glycerini]|uniref:Uroporphyrinogen decarboxylase (URO-D) n=1 Tax=Neomoorella glycerini TaxID=55779 RepID=A0A6I5ZN33_9FIRM|nr:uroporphyrinogen decarboxylase family protein [Moorella glycerini]QGP91266.1 Uroporphyrinogen decarboxylase (URO-D) [Moorella glycerini]
MTALTSRQRVLMALRHEEADMVPVDLGGTRSSTGISAIVYNQLLQYLGYDGKARVFDVKQLLAEPDERIRRFWGCDVIGLHRLRPSLGLAITSWKEGSLMDGSSCEVPADFNPVLLADGSEGIRNANGIITAVRPQGSYYFEEIYHPLKGATSYSDIDQHEFPFLSAEEENYLANKARELYEQTDYAILGNTAVSIFEKGIKDFGYEDFLIRIYSDRELVLYYLEKLTSAYLKFLEGYLNAVGKYVQIFAFHDDLGMQNNTIISPAIYREVFKPYHQRLFHFVKERKPDAYIFLHSCGSVYDLIPDLIEAGVDILNPVQLSAAKMDPANLKKEYGRHITFWGGGCSTQTTLTFGSIADVEKEVVTMLRIFGRGGGYIFAQDHNIQPGVSTEKILAMVNTVQRNRCY